MAKPSDLRRKINALLDEHAPLIQAAFMASIVDIKSQITLKLLVERLERGDIAGALDALNLERSAFGRVENAIAQAYNAGGSAMTGNMPTLRDQAGARIVVRFDSRNVRAEDWLRQHSSQLVTRIIEDQRSAIQGALQTGLSQGQNPNKTALDIVGRINRASGRREGGLIGLTAPQAEFVASARAELLSGDYAAYLKRERRSRLHDRTVMRAMREGETLDAAKIDQMIGHYADRLLDLRGKMLARTETLTSIHAAKHEGFRQGLDKTNYPPEAVTRVWRSAGDSKVRHTHAGMNGQIVQGLETPFVSPSGSMLRYPGDTGLGAGADEVIGCRCDDDYRIDFSWGVT